MPSEPAVTPAAYDLSRFAPPDVTFTIRQRVGDEIEDREFRVPGDPDSEIVVQMLRLEREVKGIDESLRRPDEAIVEARNLLIDLIRERDPAFDPDAEPRFRIGSAQILIVFALITGGASVADATAEALTAGMSLARDLTPEEVEQELARVRGEEVAEPGPFVSTGS